MRHKWVPNLDLNICVILSLRSGYGSDMNIPSKECRIPQPILVGFVSRSSVGEETVCLSCLRERETYDDLNKDPYCTSKLNAHMRGRQGECDRTKGRIECETNMFFV